MARPKQLALKTVQASVAPLAERLRPQSWQEYAGLAALDQSLIGQLTSGHGRPPSIVLWGPPGAGKTTFAKLVGRSFDCAFVEFSAVLDGVKELREVIAQAEADSRWTLLFMDEIHRFNRAQQDALLPHVERGTVTLIGATTENPSFYLTGALLSRVRVLSLPALSADSLLKLIARATQALSLSLGASEQEQFAAVAAGDARRAINLLESFAAQSTRPEVSAFLSDVHAITYDRAGESHYNLASAFIKSLRGSDPDAALVWGFRMLEGGEDPRFLLRRMIIFASEDISNADPRALTIAVSAAEAFDRIGLPEGRIPIAQAITYLASAPKSNRSYAAMNAVLQDLESKPQLTVPLHLRNAPTKLMSELGYGKDYVYPHDLPEGYVAGVDYLPPELGGRKYYKPAERGYEATIKARLEGLKKG